LYGFPGWEENKKNIPGCIEIKIHFLYNTIIMNTEQKKISVIIFFNKRKNLQLKGDTKP